MAHNSPITNREEKKNKDGKGCYLKPDGLKRKKIFYSSFKLGIKEHSSDEENDNTTPIKIFYKEKKN